MAVGSTPVAAVGLGVVVDLVAVGVVAVDLGGLGALGARRTSSPFPRSLRFCDESSPDLFWLGHMLLRCVLACWASSTRRCNSTPIFRCSTDPPMRLCRSMVIPCLLWF